MIVVGVASVEPQPMIRLVMKRAVPPVEYMV